MTLSRVWQIRIIALRGFGYDILAKHRLRTPLVLSDPRSTGHDLTKIYEVTQRASTGI